MKMTMDEKELIHYLISHPDTTVTIKDGLIYRGEQQLELNACMNTSLNIRQVRNYGETAKRYEVEMPSNENERSVSKT